MSYCVNGTEPTGYKEDSKFIE